MVIRETTHHGGYRNVRDVEVPTLAPSEVTRLLRDCPYSYAHVSTPRVLSIADDLASKGRADHGWTTWEVVES